MVNSMTKILYLDESGTSNTEVIDENYPIFMLGGVVVDFDDLEYNKQQMNAFKKKYWQQTGIILHSNEIVRRKGNFAFLNQSAVWNEFLNDLNALMDNMKYQVVSCIVDIPRYRNKYGKKAFDPYEFALRILIERFIYSMGSYEQGKIFAESRGIPLDTQIKMAFEKIKDTGAGCYIAGDEICSKIQSFEIKSKSENLIGLQLADLALPPLGRAYLGKPVRDDYKIILSKCFHKNGNVEGHGIVVIPKK